MTKVEKRRAALINSGYFIMIIGAFYLFMKYAFSIFAPFLFAFFAAMILQKPVNFVVKKTPFKKGIVSSFFVLVVLAFFVAIVSIIGIRIVSELKGLAGLLASKMGDLPTTLLNFEEWILEKIHFLPDMFENPLSQNIKELFAKLVEKGSEEIAGDSSILQDGTAPLSGLFSAFDFSILSSPLSGVWSTAKQIPGILVATLITIVSCCFMTADYDNIVNFVKRQLSTSKRFALSSTKGIFFSSLSKMIKAYLIIVFVTFCEMFVGLIILKILGFYRSDYIFAISLVIAVVDIFPVLGTGTIIIPWAIFSFATGNFGMGIGLLVIYAMISVIRQIIEPKLVAMNLGISPIITIMGMYVGLQLFGFIGIFLLPILIILLKLLNDDGIIHIWRRKEEPKLSDCEPTDSDSQADVHDS